MSQKCNHTLGYNPYDDTTVIITVDYFLLEQVTPLVKFEYRPDCGLKFDWSKINYEILSEEYPELINK